MTKKFTLSQLVSKPVRIGPLVHPQIGEVGGWVEIRSSTDQEVYIKKLQIQTRLQEQSRGDTSPSLEDFHKLNAELASLVVSDWDEVFFEREFTPEAGREIFELAEYTWIRDAILAKHQETEAFFKKD